MTSSSNKILFLFVVLIAFVDGILVTDHFYRTKPSVSSATAPVVLENILEEKRGDPEALAEESYVLPFTTQAPLGIWDKPWADYAEEACVWMAMKWVKEENFVSIYETAEELNAIGAWEVDQFGTLALTDTPQTLQIIIDYFGHQKAFLSGEISETGLKSYLDAGSVLILPVNGQILGNPNYSDPAPENHMILVYGYTEAGFLANDPGTRRGEGVTYSVQKILDSIQDLEGERIMLVVQS